MTMSTSTRIKTAALSGAFILATSGGAAEETATDSQTKAAAENTPNLVFIFSDQQSYDTLWCNGKQQIIIPNIISWWGNEA